MNLEKEEQNKPKQIEGRKNKDKSRNQQIENRQTVQKINKTKNQFFEEIKKIDKSLTREKKNIKLERIWNKCGWSGTVGKKECACFPIRGYERLMSRRLL